MTISIPSLIRKPLCRWRLRRGYTLVEVMISATLASFLLAGILSSFLFMGRSGANLRNYSDMESQARRSLEMFAEDVRQASAIQWISSQSLVLTVNSTAIIYYYQSSDGNFYRRVGSTTPQALISGIRTGTFSFKSYNVTGAEMPLSSAANLTAAGSSTKQLQISLEASRTSQTVATATNLVLSARFILRNKVVTA